jgi:hypothetical protein
MLTTMVTIPTSTVVISSIADYSNPWFVELLPFMYIGIGILGAVLVVLWLKNVILDGIYNFKENNYDDARQNALDKIQQSREIDNDFLIWKRSQK